VKREEILKEIRSIRKKVQNLSKEIESIKALSLEEPSVEKMLKIRGIRIFRKDPTDRLFFPADLPGSSKTRLYEMMKKYSFRLVVRDMIKHQDRFCIQDLTHYCSSRVAKNYCNLLCEMGVIKKGRGWYRTLVTSLYSFGPTLEWFIAEMFKKEFASPAIYGVKAKKTRSGGDFDVIASWNRRLVYVEVKSSPPKGVELSEISALFSRIDEILPEMAILFNDTQLRMKDKLVVMFEEELERRYGGESRKLYAVEKLVKELFHVGHRIYIVNSKKDITENFQICLRDHLRYRAAPHPPLSPMRLCRNANKGGEGKGEGASMAGG
jgi:hypothetical protein